MFNTAAVGAMIFGMLRFLDGLELYIRIGLYISIGILYVLSVVFAIIKKESWFKSIFALNMTLLVIVTCFSVLSAFGVFRDFSDMENIKKLILDSGSTGKLIFILMQILQIVILPVPGFIFYAAGAAISVLLRALFYPRSELSRGLSYPFPSASSAAGGLSRGA